MMKTVEEWLHRTVTIQFSVPIDDMASLVTLVFISDKEMDQAAKDLAEQLPDDMDVVFHETAEPNRMRITLVDPATGDVFTSRDEIVYYRPGYFEFKNSVHTETYLTLGYLMSDNSVKWIDPKDVNPVALKRIQFAEYSKQ